MLDLVNNLNKRICDCEPGAINTQTYLEYIIEGYAELGCPLSMDQIIYLSNTDNNEYLNDLLLDLDDLLTK